MTRTRLTDYRFLYVGPHGEQISEPEHMRARIPVRRPGSRADTSDGPTYSDYFHAIRAVLEAHREELLQALSAKTGCEEDSIAQIDIVSEKHGSDYHPARIRVRSREANCAFVMNVALTERGKARLGQEFRLLRRFRDCFSRSFLPEVYFEAQDWEISSDKPHGMCMFMGEWFDEYHEFHLSRGQDGKCDEVAVWDFRRGVRRLSEHERNELYRQTAYVLTYYYNVNTFEEVYPWHHASGDFVLRQVGDAVDVKLVTARQYAPRVEYREDGPEHRVEALWLFLANLTLRNRLDRVDGVGDTALAGEYSVYATLNGFARALDTQSEEGRVSAQLLGEFEAQAREMSPAELARIFAFVVSSYPEDAPEISLVGEHLIDHVFHVFRGLQRGIFAARGGVES
ncbi:MAG: hypothetical protein AB1646_16390 [Thermodesulfobacteriota bacterium]